MTLKNTKMTASAKLKLASIPRVRCAKCNKVKTYRNPVAVCWECKQKFCFDDINCLQFKEGMKKTDNLRDVCDACKEKHGYKYHKDFLTMD
jgi:hypothetical protein